MKALVVDSDRWMIKASILSLLLSFSVLTSCYSSSKAQLINLKEGFQNPPESAKPRVWWHWMNGNISKEGIKADLEWMKRIGIGGFQNFDAGLASPQVVKKRLIYMTPEWKEAFLFATKLADSLKLEMAIAGSPGWSESGGPWVPPSQAMKKLVWSKVIIDGGKTFTGSLPKPPTTTGEFQNIMDQDRKDSSLPLPEYYADAAVVACKIPSNDLSLSDLKPKVTSSAGEFELSTLIDGDLANSTFLPAAKPNEKSWVQFEFSQPATVNSLTLAIRNYQIPGLVGDEINGALEASDDGLQFKTIFEIPAAKNKQRTFTFTPVLARFFRITFRLPSTSGLAKSADGATPEGINIAEINLHSIARVNRFEDKAGFTASSELYSFATPPVSASDIIKKSDIVILTSKMRQDGSLNWTPPAGRWEIIRFGYSLTGHQNSPASPEATGFEVDKLNADYVKAYFNNYLDQYKDATGGLMGKRGLQYIITDSWEAGVQNWTDNMVEEFSKHRGYDMLPWMPVLTGQIVESAEASDRFLWDLRKTIADLTAENHYDQLTTILHDRNMGRYTESHESGRAFIGDGMEVKRKADIPMSAMWTPAITKQDVNENGEVRTINKVDMRESASVAHIYGKDFVAAESMTTNSDYAYAMGFSPETLKPTADMELAMGLNRFVIHTSVHQPVSDKIPGLGLGPYGQWFTRNETWAEQAKPWTTYLARNSFMLQQGKFVADIIYYYGEDNNITALFRDKMPDLPAGFNYDFVNADALLNVLSVEKGNIVTPSGMSYRLLALDPNSQHMSLPVLLKIRDMVKEGAVVVGPRPISSPSLCDDQTEFQLVVNQLWADKKGENSFGKGKVYAGQTVAEALKAMQLTPDFEYTKPKDDTRLLFVHRKLSDTDIYWVNNRFNRTENLEATFRVKGKAIEIWHPVTGKIEKSTYFIEGETTRVPLNLEPNDAVFVVFSKKAKGASFVLPQTAENLVETISGPWKISFQPKRGAPSQITLDRLSSWSENQDSGIKYFSGTAAYAKGIQAPANWFKKKERLWLDLGEVKNIAEVFVNGKALGIIWKKPFRVDVTEALKPGENTLEIRVTDLWVNRIIGDLQPENATKYTYTTQAFFRANTPLLPSGLLGPVQIIRVGHN